MLNIIENTIKERLKTVFPRFEIDGFPKNFDTYKFYSHNGAMLVRFEGSSASLQTLTAVNSYETFNYTVFAAFRYPKKHEDCYSDLGKLKTTLNGLPILHKRLEVKKTAFEAEINGDLWWSIDCSIMFPIKDEYADQSQCAAII